MLLETVTRSMNPTIIYLKSSGDAQYPTYTYYVNTHIHQANIRRWCLLPSVFHPMQCCLIAYLQHESEIYCTKSQLSVFLKFFCLDVIDLLVLSLFACPSSKVVPLQPPIWGIFLKQRSTSHPYENSHLLPDGNLSNDWVLLKAESSKWGAATATIKVSFSSHLPPGVSATVVGNEQEAAEKIAKDGRCCTQE